MRFSITALVRLVLLLGLASALLAIEVARFSPRGLHTRSLRRSHIVGIAGLTFAGMNDGTRFLDPETGAMTLLPLPKGEYFDDAVCSPWQDEEGVSHVVGRWRKGSGEEREEVLTELGLACYTFPKGEEVARIYCDVLPQGGACWYPGTSDRVLFTSADGALYHLSFDTGTRTRRQPAGDEGESVPLRWDVAPPGGHSVMLRQPFWPRVRGFERTLLVSLRYLVPQPSDRGYTEAQLWWLKLNAEGTAIVAAGRLTQAPGVLLDESAPSLAATPGGLVVAYVTCALDELDRRLHVAPVRLDPQTGVPSVDAAREVVLATDCADFPPAFTADGRRLYTVVNAHRPGARLERFDVPKDLAGRSESRGVAREPHARDAHAG